MSNTIFGMPTPAQVIKAMDAYLPQFAVLYAQMGVNAPTETNTAAALADTARSVLLGDGGSNLGLGHPGLESKLRDTANAIVMQSRGDMFYKMGLNGLFEALSAEIQTALPSGWDLTPGGIHALDGYLLRVNGAHSGVPTTPAAAGTVAAVNNSLGAIPPVVVGSAPILVHTLVGARDCDESLPSPNGTQVALAGANNAYTYTLAGTVPVGTTKVRMYRTFLGGAIKYWIKDIAVTAGASYPVITVYENDATLRTDILPPSWMQAPLLPEHAALFAWVYGSLIQSNVGSGLNDARPLQYGQMLSPENIVLDRSDDFAGGSPASSLEFGRHVIGTGYSAGAIRTANAAESNALGFAGSLGNGTTGIQARVISALNATGTVTITYTYFDAANGWGSVQTQAAAVSGAFSGTAVGSLAVWAIPAGRIVRSITVVSATTGIASGTLVFEGKQPR